MVEKERSQLQSELAMFYSYTMALTRELRTVCIPVLPPPQIPGRGPVIPLHEPGYMPVPPSSSGNWVLLLRL